MAFYAVNEIIFCGKDISSEKIIYWMSSLGPDINYKIVPETKVVASLAPIQKTVPATFTPLILISKLHLPFNDATKEYWILA